MPEDPIRLEDCRTPEDLDRLSADDLLELERPATLRDVYRLRLAVQVAIFDLAEEVGRALQATVDALEERSR